MNEDPILKRWLDQHADLALPVSSFLSQGGLLSLSEKCPGLSDLLIPGLHVGHQLILFLFAGGESCIQVGQLLL